MQALCNLYPIGGGVESSSGVWALLNREVTTYITTKSPSGNPTQKASGF